MGSTRDDLSLPALAEHAPQGPLPSLPTEGRAPRLQPGPDEIHIFHRWVAVSVDRLRYVHLRWGDGEQVGPSSPITEVLQRCSACGHLRTITLDGEWTLAEVTAGAR